MRKVLFISHFFPPCGGAGVQRSSKFVKYLPSEGVIPIVVTGKSKPDERWSPEDLTLLADLPVDLLIYRAEWNQDEPNSRRRQSERRNALIRVSDEVIRAHCPDLILVTMSPFQDAEIGFTLSKKHRIPWVADLRDPWALDEIQVYRTFFHRHYERLKMRRLLRTALGVIMNTPEAKKRLVNKMPEFKGRLVTSITNGFDADDFMRTSKREKRNRFRIVHTGSFHTSMGIRQKANRKSYWLLGRCETGLSILPRSPFYLLQAIERICREEPTMRDMIEVVFAGVVSQDDLRLIEESEVRSLVNITGYLGHSESALQTAEADLLFLPLHSICKGRRASIVPGKTYEYIASGNPILAALPDGDARDYVKKAGNSWAVDPDDIEGLAEGILHFYSRWKADNSLNYRPASAIQEFDRRHLTKQLSHFLLRVTQAFQGSGNSASGTIRL